MIFKSSRRRIRHFGQSHPLDSFKYRRITENDYSCCWCNKPLSASGISYGSFTCGFFLHELCSVNNMPRRLEHPFHPSHPLYLRYTYYLSFFHAVLICIPLTWHMLLFWWVQFCSSLALCSSTYSKTWVPQLLCYFDKKICRRKCFKCNVCDADCVAESIDGTSVCNVISTSILNVFHLHL